MREAYVLDTNVRSRRGPFTHNIVCFITQTGNGWHVEVILRPLRLNGAVMHNVGELVHRAKLLPQQTAQAQAAAIKQIKLALMAWLECRRRKLVLQNTHWYSTT